MTNSQLNGHAAMVGANCMWGLMAPIAKMVMAGAVVTPLLLTNFRIVGAALLFWLTSWISGLFGNRPEHVPAADKLRLAGAAVLGILTNQGCYVFGVGYTAPGDAALITTTMPMWVMVLAAVVLREPITLKKAGGIALGACGALLLVLTGRGRSVSGDNPVLGDLLVLTAQLSYALYLTFYKNFVKKYSVVTLMKWMFTFAACATLPAALPSLLRTDWAALTAGQSAGVAYVVCCGTFLAYICIMIGQKTLRPTLVGMYNYLQPIVATCVGIAMGLELMTASKLMAIALIFTGVYLVTISKAKGDDVKSR